MSRSSFHCPIAPEHNVITGIIVRRCLFDGKCPYESWLFSVNKRHFPPAKYSGETEVPSIGTFFVIHSPRGRGTNHRPREGGGWWRSPAMHRRPQRWISRCRPTRPHRRPLVPPSGARYSTCGVISSGDEKTRPRGARRRRGWRVFDGRSVKKNDPVSAARYSPARSGATHSPGRCSGPRGASSQTSIATRNKSTATRWASPRATSSCPP